MELSLNQTLQNEAIAARNEQALEPSEGTDALAAAEASIAHHEQVKNAESGTERYPNQAKSLVRAMEQQGVDFNYESVSPESELADAYDGFFTLNHGEKESKEPTVRLYRGVRDVNGSILEQASYALKSLDSVTLDGGPHEREIKAGRRQETRTKIHRFIDNPTFDNLSEYVKGLETFATPKEREKLTERMKRIETAVSEKGISVEEALREEHVNSSTFDGGLEISPYVAASADPEAAGFYADGALLAIDVPASQIAGYGEMGEVLIKGELTAENIAGVAVRKSNNSSVKQHPPAGSYEQITRMIPASESMNYDNVRGQLETAQTEREAKFAIIDRQQVEKVRSEREKRRQERAARIE
jgi:hypothetical protein